MTGPYDGARDRVGTELCKTAPSVSCSGSMDIEDVLALALNAARGKEPPSAVLLVLVQHGARASVVQDAVAVCSDRYGADPLDVQRARDLLESCLCSGALLPD